MWTHSGIFPAENHDASFPARSSNLPDGGGVGRAGDGRFPAGARAAAGEPAGVGDEASLVVFNRQIIVFRAPFLGIGPAPRVARARLVIEETLRQGGDLVVAVKPDPEGQLVMIDDKLAFVVTPGDVDPLLQETVETAAQAAAKRLETVVAETREARSARSLLMALTASAVATAVFVALLWLLGRLRTWLTRVTVAAAERKAEALKVGGLQLVEVRFLIPVLQRALQVLRWLLIVLLTYEWLGFVLSRFPYTRPWGERLNEYLLGIAEEFRRRNPRRHSRPRRRGRDLLRRPLLHRLSSAASSSAPRKRKRRSAGWPRRRCR